jgi:hypothetical protein
MRNASKVYNEVSCAALVALKAVFAYVLVGLVSGSVAPCAGDRRGRHNGTITAGSDGSAFSRDLKGDPFWV